MSHVLRVIYGEGDLADQLFSLKMSAIANRDVPWLWRLTEELVASLIEIDRTVALGRWPQGSIAADRLFDVAVDLVREGPHLLCENHVVYPYVPPAPDVFRAA